MGDTIHLCHGVPCQPRQWTWNRHAPRQVRDDSLSCPNDGGMNEHNRLRALGLVGQVLYTPFVCHLQSHAVSHTILADLVVASSR